MEVRFAHSALKDGPMGISKDLTKEAKANRERFIKENLKADPSFAATACLVHGKKVVEISEKDAGSMIPECDGLITRVPNLPLLVAHQDCMPIFLYDKGATFVSCLHAGWRGILNGILREAILKIKNLIPDFQNVFLSSGPSIQKCHFEIKEDVMNLFIRNYLHCLSQKDGKVFLNLGKVLFAQAICLGIPKDNIRISPECTYCARDELGFKYFSRRRENIRENSMIAVIALKQPNDDYPA